MNPLDRLSAKLAHSSLLWGAALSVAFYALLEACSAWVSPWFVRLATGHWESYVCTSLFFVGLVSLGMRVVDATRQFMTLSRRLFDKFPENEPVENRTSVMLAQLVKIKAPAGDVLDRRLYNALEFANRGDADSSFLDRLRELSLEDRKRMEARYELSRFLIGALPAVGSLSTVLGIGTAVSQLSASSSADLVAGVAVGLAEAFDAFALALAFSLLLVLFKFVARQGDLRLLAGVDDRVNRELKSQIDAAGSAAAAHRAQLKSLAESVATATEALARRGESSLVVRAADEGAGQRLTPADERQMEAIVERAVATALERRASSGGISIDGTAMGGSVNRVAGDMTSADMAGWNSLQQALQQVADYLTRQQAKQEYENDVVAQLLAMVDEDLQDDENREGRPRLRLNVSPDTTRPATTAASA